MLLDANEQPIAAIEVLVSHAPETKARAFYAANNIAVLEFALLDEDDLQPLRRGELVATAGTACARRKCPACHGPLFSSPLIVVIGECYRCRRPMKMAFKQTRGGIVAPEEFAPDDIRRASAAGCILQRRYSSVTGTRYLANCCGGCGTFTGSFYLHDYFYRPNIAPGKNAEVYCPECERHFDGELPP